MLIVSQGLENDKRLAVAEQVESLLGSVTRAAERSQSAHEVERLLWDGVRQMGHRLLDLYFSLLGAGDEGEEVERAGCRLKRSSSLQRRHYLSVFGPLELERWTYSRGAKRRVDYAPLDERAGLPKMKYSYVLQDWSQHLATELAYQPMQEVLERFLGQRLSVAALEKMTREVSATVDSWWADQQLPAKASVEADQVTVLSADAKGVVMRSAVTEKPLAGRSMSGSGPTPGRCKMAVLGAAYTVKAWERTPEQVLAALFGQTLERTTTLAANDPDYAKARPTPLYKQVRAALSTAELGEPGHATAVIFPWLAEQLQQRDPDQKRPCVLLIDGQHTLWEQAGVHLTRADRIEVLDLLHALSYFWSAVHLFHRPATTEAIKLMEVMSLALLQGKGLTALIWLADQAPACGLTHDQRAELDKIRAYFEAHRDRIHYDQYLARGLPIASGVIEGACRHVINDRLNRTGMRWTLDGAQAMLRLRCVAINGLWDDLIGEHIQRETARLYPHRNHEQPIVSEETMLEIA